MPRLMSVSMTKQAVIDRTKTVTRRKGWAWLQPGTRLTLVEKAMGLKKGEQVVRLAEVEVISVRRESLALLAYPDPDVAEEWTYAWGEVQAEGFPHMGPWLFVNQFFVQAQGMDYEDSVTRIEWRYLDDEQAVDPPADLLPRLKESFSIGPNEMFGGAR